MSIPTKTLEHWPPRVKSLTSLHRLAGIVLVLPVLLLVATGVPLQFTEQLQLGKAGVNIGWLQSRYSIVAPDLLSVSGQVRQIDGVVLIAQRVIDTDYMGAGKLVGSTSHASVTSIAFENAMLLVPHDGSIPIEVTTPPQRILRFGSVADGLVINTAQACFASANLGASWQPSICLDVLWHSATQEQADSASRAQYRASKLTWERVLTDMHSGRLFGRPGEWVMNFASFALILLAITGLVMWIMPRKR